MLKWIKKRLAEKSTYIGLATTVMGVGQLIKIDDATAIADAIHSAAEPLSTGDYATGLGVLGMGILGMIMHEKGAK